jgi:hypothetical protein
MCTRGNAWDAARWAAVGVCSLLVLASAAHGAVLRVDAYNGDDANNGTAWGTDALQTIEAAISQAAAGDEIWVKMGTYAATTHGSV